MSLRYLAFAGCLPALVVACNPIPAPRPAQPGPAAALYDEHCAECHGSDGWSTEGNPAAPNLAGQGLLTVADDAFLHANTSRSRPGANAPDSGYAEAQAFSIDYGGPLTNEQIDDLVAHIRAWQSEPSVELGPYVAGGDAERGRATYHVCTPCHGQAGWSERAPSLAGETFQDTASDAFIRHTVLHGRPGSEMVGFALEDGDVADLIVHIRRLRHRNAAAALPAP